MNYWDEFLHDCLSESAETVSHSVVFGKNARSDTPFEFVVKFVDGTEFRKIMTLEDYENITGKKGPYES